jgi:hypothetical protein
LLVDSRAPEGCPREDSAATHEAPNGVRRCVDKHLLTVQIAQAKALPRKLKRPTAPTVGAYRLATPNELILASPDRERRRAHRAAEQDLHVVALRRLSGSLRHIDMKLPERHQARLAFKL